MSCFFLKSTAAAAVIVVMAKLAATEAAASYVSVAPLPAGIFSSPTVLWLAANAIVVLLFASFRQHRTATAAASPARQSGDESPSLDSFYPLSESELPAAVAADAVAVAPVAVSTRQPREARAAMRAERPRVRKKPAGQEAMSDSYVYRKKPSEEVKPRAVVAEAMSGGMYLKKSGEKVKPRAIAAAEAKPDWKEPGERWPRTVAPAAETTKLPGEAWPRNVAAVAAAEAKPDDTDESMDSLWSSIVRRGAARPVAAPKSESWSCDEMPRLKRSAERAVARREMRKSASLVPASPPHPAAAAAKQPGWRTRDVLAAISPDELLRRAESLIRRHHEQLNLQRQESSEQQRQAVEHHRRAHALIRV